MIKGKFRGNKPGVRGSTQCKRFVMCIDVVALQCSFNVAQMVGHVAYPEWCQGSEHAELVP